MFDWNQIKDRWSSFAWRGTAPFTLPPIVVEAQSDFVMGARLAAKVNGDRGDGNGKTNGAGRSGELVRRIAVRQLEAGSVRPGPAIANIANVGEVTGALRGVTEVLGNGTARFGLLVPDGVVRVAMLGFETLPSDRREAEALVRWRMKESLPFPSEEAKITYQRVGGETGEEAASLELLVVAARRQVLAEYEAALEEVNGGSASILMLPSTLALLPLLPETEGAAQALVHVCSGSVTHVVLDRGRVSLWRTREIAAADPEGLLDGVATEASRVLAASEDRLQVQIGQVWLCGRPPAAPDLAEPLSRVLGRDVRLLEPDSAFAAGLPADEQQTFNQYGATVAGLVQNCL